MDEKLVEKLLEEHGFEDYRFIDAQEIVVRQWVRSMCIHSCPDYGQRAVCPPNMPDIEECERFFSEYDHALIIRFEMAAHHRGEDASMFFEIDEALLELEKKLFYEGYPKALLLPATVCYRCDDCMRTPTACRHKEKARPTPEALGVDLFTTVKKVGYPLHVIKDEDDTMNRYAILMVA